MNLKQKSFLFVAVSVTLLVAAFVGVSQYYLDVLADGHLRDRRQAAELAAKNLDEFFARATAKIDVIAQLPLLLNGLRSVTTGHAGLDPATFDTLHYLTYKSDLFTQGVYLVSTDGKIIWSEPRDQDIVNSPYAPFARIRDSFRAESAPAVSFIPWEGTKGNASILVAEALVGPDGTLEGYVVGDIPTDHDAIAAIIGAKANSNATMQIVTLDGLVIAVSDGTRLMRQLSYRERLLEAAQLQPGGVLVENLVIGYQVLEKLPFILASDESAAGAFADIRNLRLILTGIGILTLTLVMATLTFVVRSFTRPVELLTEEARRIAAGDMEGRFTADRDDEIGVLAHSLEDMKVRIRSSYDRLMQSEKMSLMGQVVAGIAHELNNPLTIVIGHTELMMLKGVEEKYRQPLARIHDGAERASKIVKNLLTFARQRKPERVFSDINAIVTRTIDLRAYELGVSNIELTTDLSPDLPSTLCDPHQLQQVVLNLIVNAEQAMLEANRRGELAIRTALHEGVIHIVVEDNGPGIPANDLRRVFDPFFTTKEVGKGTGLGLAICQGIVAEHDGRLTVTSTPGFGAVFTLELPVVARTPESVPTITGKPASNPSRPRKVLVVDDENPMRELLTQLLHSDGYAVMTAGSGREALDLIARDKYDLVITDIKMPDIDGPAFLAELRRTNSPLSDRILFITGDIMSAATLGFLEKCGSPWIAKPFELTVVRDTVRRILAS